MGRFSELDEKSLHNNSAESEKRAAEVLRNELKKNYRGNKVRYTVMTTGEYAEASEYRPPRHYASQNEETHDGAREQAEERLVVVDHRYHTYVLSDSNKLFNQETVDEILEDVGTDYLRTKGMLPDPVKIVKRIIKGMLDIDDTAIDDFESQAKYIAEVKNIVLDHLLNNGNPISCCPPYVKKEKKILQNKDRGTPDLNGKYSESEDKEYEVWTYDYQKIDEFNKQLNEQLELQTQIFADPKSDYNRKRMIETRNDNAKEDLASDIRTIYDNYRSGVQAQAEEDEPDEDEYDDEEEPSRSASKPAAPKLPETDEEILRELTQKTVKGEAEPPQAKTVTKLIDRYFELKTLVDITPRLSRLSSDYREKKNYLKDMETYLVYGCHVSKIGLRNEMKKTALKENYAKSTAYPDVKRVGDSLKDAVKDYNKHGFLWKTFLGRSSRNYINHLSDTLIGKGVAAEVVDLLKKPDPTKEEIGAACRKHIGDVKGFSQISDQTFRSAMVTFDALQDLAKGGSMESTVAAERAGFVQKCLAATGEKPETVENGTFMQGKDSVSLTVPPQDIKAQEAQMKKDIAASIRTEKETGGVTEEIAPPIPKDPTKVANVDANLNK